jgi:hypothetical protein
VAKHACRKDTLLVDLGDYELARHRRKPAIASYERALAATEDPALRALAELGLARALWPVRGQRERSLELARSAQDGLAGLGRGELAAEVTTWLGERGAR